MAGNGFCHCWCIALKHQQQRQLANPYAPLQVPVIILVEQKRGSWLSASIVQSCIRYTKLTIQPYLYTLKSVVLFWEYTGKASLYLEWLKIEDAHISSKTCYTFLTRLRKFENNPFFSFTRVNKASLMRILRDRGWFCHNACHKIPFCDKKLCTTNRTAQVSSRCRCWF